jgi:hypothetical protein
VITNVKFTSEKLKKKKKKEPIHATGLGGV